MAISAEEFKQSLRYWASGIAVVTTKPKGKDALGMTVSSFASVSLEPPQILVCLNHSAETGNGIQESGFFAVNVLTSEQESVSNDFSGAHSMQQRFASNSWSFGDSGVPLLDNSLTSLECKVVQQIKAGTHWIIVGEVGHVICRSGSPLLYFDSGYHHLA